MTGSGLGVRAVLLLTLAIGCAGGPPRHTSEPADSGQVAAPEEAREEPIRAASHSGVPVRVGLHWQKGTVEISSETGLTFQGTVGGRDWETEALSRFRVSAGGGTKVRVVDEKGRTVREPGPIRFEPKGSGRLVAGDIKVRGTLVVYAQSDTVVVVNVLGLEDYLRGVVPREIGDLPAEERSAVAAQAVAARTYTVKRLGQYSGLPFDMFSSVLDQVYEGVGGESAVADDAIRGTRGLVLANGAGLIEAYYSSTCGGKRSDIANVWPHRDVYEALRGGPDGEAGSEWCRESRHFTWRETWTGKRLSALVREHLPELLEVSRKKIRGDLVDLKIVNRGPSGRAAEIEYILTDGGIWKVPGDKNRWIMRRPDGSILRSVLFDLHVKYKKGKVTSVSATGHGNGHGVGMCQIGAIVRARMGQDYRAILGSYYPGAEVRPILDADLPDGLAAAS